MRDFFKNVWLYRKVLRDERQWDYSFIFQILERKMQLLHKGLNKDYRVLIEHHNSHNQYLRDLRQCIYICNQLSCPDAEVEDMCYAKGIDVEDVYLDRLHFYMRRSCKHWWS